MDKRPFKPEAHYILKGTHYLVLTPYVDGSRLVEDVRTGQQFSQHIQDLWKYWKEGDLQFVLQEANLQFEEQAVYLEAWLQRPYEVCFMPPLASMDETLTSYDNERQSMNEHCTVIHSNEQRQTGLSEVPESELTDDLHSYKPSIRGSVEQLFMILNKKE